MNAFITKTNSYFIANKVVIISGLLIVNIFLFLAHNMQQTEWMGTIETSTQHWSKFTQQHTDSIRASITISNSGENDVNEIGKLLEFTFSPIANNELILYNPDMPIKFYRTRVYAIDEKCRLTFKGRKTMKLFNASMICRL